MAITTVRCAVLQGNVSRVINLEGEVTAVLCPEYEELTGVCRLKRRVSEGGPLSRLLERVSEDTLDSKSVQCVLR